ncbi:ArsR/SmtB family transcription factor [Methanobrevibacter sp.]|uniref:ArsR/SmtB family transcription factor n=1 Tax=Methanobrevibacter sp. TaxID=66852 RepID=UPI00388EBE4B
MTGENEQTNRHLEHIILQKKGGKTTARMIELLLVRPYNSNQIAKTLNISYNTAYYHFQIMVKLDLVEKVETKYGTYYSAKENLIKAKDKFEEIKKLI